MTTETVHASGQWPEPAHLLPHPAPVRLLDEVVSVEGSSLIARFTPTPEHWFADTNGAFPAATGIEMLAQASAALFTLVAKSSAPDASARAGMLIANRSYRSDIGTFSAGTPLLLEVTAQSPIDSVLGSSSVLVRFTGRIGLAAEANTSTQSKLSAMPADLSDVTSETAEHLHTSLAEAAFSVYLPASGAET